MPLESTIPHLRPLKALVKVLKLATRDKREIKQKVESFVYVSSEEEGKFSVNKNVSSVRANREATKFDNIAGEVRDEAVMLGAIRKHENVVKRFRTKSNLGKFIKYVFVRGLL